MLRKSVLALSFVLVLILGVTGAAQAAVGPQQEIAPPTVQSDKLDYAPGELVTLSGGNWQGDTAVLIVVNDDAGQTWSRSVLASVAADGTIADSFNIPSWFVANYSVTATGQQTGRVAMTSFTDMSIGTYDQCSNDTGTGFTSGDTGCRWINGNLQKTNSFYQEGDATVQRLWLTNFEAGSTHTLTLHYGTTKGGLHAYDYLTSWNWSEDWITLADLCQGITGCTTASVDKLTIPDDSLAPEPADTTHRQFEMHGGDLTSATTPAIESGTYGNDSETEISITFTVASSGDMCRTTKDGTICDVALFFGAHIATQVDWGKGNGAGSITGSPYHVELKAIDGGAIGSRDNQMQAEVVAYVPPGTIIIIKDAIPNDPQDFSFNLHNTPTTIDKTFQLDDDSDSTLPNTTSPNYVVPVGTWTVSELNLPISGWDFTKLVCVDPTSNTTVNGAVATIDLASNETVTCTYTNTKGATGLTIGKTTNGTYDKAFGWTIEKSVDPAKAYSSDGSGTFNYTVNVKPDAGTISNVKVKGTITVNNPNAVNVAILGVTDKLSDDTVCSVTGSGAQNLPPGDSTFAYECSLTALPTGELTNIATVSYADQTLSDGSWLTAGTKTYTSPSVSFTPTLIDDCVEANDTVAGYLGKVCVGDSNPPPFTYSKTYTGDPAGTCTDHKNVADFVTNTTKTTGSANATATVCVGKDLTVEKTAAGTFDRAYLWKISKDVDKTLAKIAEGGSATFNYTIIAEQTGISDSGWTLSGKITITNPNDWEAVTLSDLSDVVDNGGTCTVDAGPYVVPKSGKLDVNYSCSYADKPSDYSGTNTATATWDKAAYYTPSDTASGNATFKLSQLGSTNKTVTITDTYEGVTTELGKLTAADEEPWTSGTYNPVHTQSGVAGTCTDYNNTAKIVEADLSAGPVKVSVCVGKDLTVTKTAAGTFDRAYLWQISKDVDQTLVKIAEGGSATFTYKIIAQQIDISDSGWTLSGKITITNPNDWEDVTLSDLSDAVDNGGTCTVDAGPYVVPKSDKLDVNYSCSYADKPSSYSGTNTATATWDKAAYFTPSGSDSGDALFTLSQLGATNKTVTITDTYEGVTTELGKLTATDAKPYASGTYNPVHTPSGVAGTCTDYDNTAKIVETGQADSEKVTVCVGKDPAIDKTVTAAYRTTWKWDVQKNADKTEVKMAEGDTATFTFTVDVSNDGGTDSGWAVNGKITLTNPNDWEDITLSDLSDVVDNGGTCTLDAGPYVVPTSGSLDVNYSCTYASAPNPIDGGYNTATATWDYATYYTPNGAASVAKAIAFTQAKVDDCVTVSDPLDPNSPHTFCAGDAGDPKWSFSYDFSTQGTAGTGTEYKNTVTLKTDDTGGTDSDEEIVGVYVAKDLTIDKTVDASYKTAYIWSIVKNADKTEVKMADGSTATFTFTVDVGHDEGAASGWAISGKITVTNPNDWEPITLSNLGDVVDNGGTCTVDAGPYVVPKSGSLDVNYSCTYAGAPSPLIGGKNTATATWDKATYYTPTDTASTSKDIAFKQELVDECVNVSDPLDPKSPRTFCVGDTGDPKFGFSYDFQTTGVAGECKDYDNTATFTTNDTGATGSDPETVKVCVGVDLKVEKTAVPAFTRTYLWDITKDVTPQMKEIAVGNAVFNYTVKVWETGFEDKDWSVSGKITITNPNKWEPITITDFQDVAVPACDGITFAVPYELAADKAVEIPYTCTYPTNPESGSNTAAVKWDATASYTPTGEASDKATFEFGAPSNPVNKCVNIYDTFNGGEAGWLFKVCATDAEPYASVTHNYTRSIPVQLGCQDYPNTAKIDETGQSDSEKVTVCGPMQIGGKTMGFWQNKNGQSIILKSGPASGVCELTAWLRQFAPFKDLSGSASCTTVAKYVFDTIKLANSAGTSLNSMLKGQMLATALDVYFSDPALGGNKIGAAAPIGDVVIDLTKICKNASNCTSFENVSAAFGGATSMSVMDMLTYAASQSNLGGSDWYSNIKAKQELAKDAFDAINNQKVFGP